MEECKKKNWDEKIQKMKNTLISWKRRNLTIFGKITIIKSLILPIITFVAQSTCIPPNATKEINKLLFDFIWGKRDRIKRNIMYQDMLEGGVNMIDIDAFFTSLKAAWMSKLFNHCDTWNCIAHKHFNCIGDITSITNFHFEKTNCFQHVDMLPNLYKEVLMSYAKANTYSKPKTKEECLEQPLWGNKHITVYNNNLGVSTILLFKEWIDTSIYYVKDLRFIDGNFDQKYVENIVTNKRDILRQMLLIRKAIKPLMVIIGDHEPIKTEDNAIKTVDITVKGFYKQLTDQSKVIHCPSLRKWEHNLNKQCNFKTTFKKKIYNIKDFKIKEFNFKVIHGILSCEANLKMWKLQDYDECIECGKQHNILHLLYECPNATTLWKLFETCFNHSISADTIIVGDISHANETNLNFVISLLCFLLYKYWLLKKNENITIPMKYFMIKELHFRTVVYKTLSWEEISMSIEQLEHHIMTCM